MKVAWAWVERLAVWAGVLVAALVFTACRSNGKTVGVSGTGAAIAAAPFLLLAALGRVPDVVQAWRREGRTLSAPMLFAGVSCLLVRAWTKDPAIPREDRAEIAFWFSAVLTLVLALWIGRSVVLRARRDRAASSSAP